MSLPSPLAHRQIPGWNSRSNLIASLESPDSAGNETEVISASWKVSCDCALKSKSATVTLPAIGWYFFSNESLIQSYMPLPIPAPHVILPGVHLTFATCLAWKLSGPSSLATMSASIEQPSNLEQ